MLGKDEITLLHEEGVCLSFNVSEFLFCVQPVSPVQRGGASSCLGLELRSLAVVSIITD
jgi:hypothetical protein